MRDSAEADLVEFGDATEADATLWGWGAIDPVGESERVDHGAPDRRRIGEGLREQQEVAAATALEQRRPREVVAFIAVLEVDRRHVRERWRRQRPERRRIDH